MTPVSKRFPFASFHFSSANSLEARAGSAESFTPGIRACAWLTLVNRD